MNNDKWISVDEAMPKPLWCNCKIHMKYQSTCNACWLYCDIEFSGKIIEKVITQGYYDFENKEWKILTNLGKKKLNIKSVTHWKYLPAPTAPNKENTLI